MNSAAMNHEGRCEEHALRRAALIERLASQQRRMAEMLNSLARTQRDMARTLEQLERP